MRYERGARASHFVCISFSLSVSFFFLSSPVPLHSWKRSNPVRRQTLPRLRCRFFIFFIKGQTEKLDPRGQILSGQVSTRWSRRSRLVFAPLAHCNRETLRCRGVKKVKLKLFLVAVVLSSSARDDSHVIDERF